MPKLINVPRRFFNELEFADGSADASFPSATPSGRCDKCFDG